jgi:hypothetical protein
MKGEHMDYEGVIIKESLKDPELLHSVQIVSTTIEPVTDAHETPWLKQWTLHTVIIPAARAGEIAESLSHELETEHDAWYIDFKNNTTHYIVFPGKVFKIDRTKADEYQAATSYGLTLGIPAYQLDFSPSITEWQRPTGPNSWDERQS